MFKVRRQIELDRTLTTMVLASRQWTINCRSNLIPADWAPSSGMSLSEMACKR